MGSAVINLLRRIADDETGASAAEYAVLTALLLPAVVAGVVGLNTALISFFTTLGSRLTEIADVLF
jgi:Flp pilus assembly pilin Flp